MMMYKKYSSALSLVELLAAIAIIGIIASLAAPTYNSYVISSKISSAIEIIPQFKSYMVSYESQFGRFPTPAQVFAEFSLTADLCDGNYCRDNDVGWPNIDHFQYSDYGDGRKLSILIQINDASFAADNGWLSLYCGYQGEYLKCACGAEANTDIYPYLPDSCKDDTSSVAWFDAI